jgi:hypothetical protein
VYFVPYIYLFLCYLADRLGHDETVATASTRAKALVIGLSGLALTLFAMFIATVPPAGTEEPWLFRGKVIGGAAAFVLLGGVLFLRGRR